MNKTLPILGDCGFEREHVLVVAGIVSGGAVLADGLIGEDVDVGLVGAGEQALAQVGEVGARNAGVGGGVAVGAIRAEDHALVLAHHLEVVIAIIGDAGEAVIGIILARYATALAWLTLVSTIVAEVARVALSDAGVIDHVFVVDGSSARC